MKDKGLCIRESAGCGGWKSSRELPGLRGPVTDLLLLMTEDDQTLNPSPITLAVFGLRVPAPQNCMKAATLEEATCCSVLLSSATTHNCLKPETTRAVSVEHQWAATVQNDKPPTEVREP